VYEYASKIITRYDPTLADHPIKQQLIFADCGCGGSGAGVGIEENYEYIVDDLELWTASLTRQSAIGSTPVYRTIIDEYDLVGESKAPYLVTHAIVEGNSGAALQYRCQVTHHTYRNSVDGTDRVLVMTQTPSACSGDQAAYVVPTDSLSALPASRYTGYADWGLVYLYGYTSDGSNRLRETYIVPGHGLGTQAAAHQELSDPAFVAPGTGMSAVTGAALIERITYGQPSDPPVVGELERVYLPSRVDRFRVFGSESQGNVETTLYQYGFYSSGGLATDAIAWMQTAVERETVAENGSRSNLAAPSLASPTTIYSSYSLYDRVGQGIWSRAADGSMTRRSFDTRTGALVEEERNADATALGSQFPVSGGDALSTSDWASTDRYDDGGSLTVTSTVDLSGRVRSVTKPGGITERVRRQMVKTKDYNDIPLFTVVAIPDETGASIGAAPYAGPVVVTWHNAGDNRVRVSHFALESLDTQIGNDSALTALLDLEAMGSWSALESARSTTELSVNGQTTATKVWHRTDGSGIVESDFYTTTYTHDDYGRLLNVVNPQGTARGYTYDALDRMITESVGIGTATELVRTMVYDSTTATSAFRSGLMTSQTEHVHPDTPEVRSTTFSYDERDRLELVTNPIPPDEQYVYDNLDRTIEHRVLDGAGATGRLTRTAYSQRGLVYRTQIAVDPSCTSSCEWLRSYSWFDENGRVVGKWEPNGPIAKTTYDGLGRTKAVYITDRDGDKAPGTGEAGTTGTTNGFTNVHLLASHTANLTGDRVVEQVEYRYISTGLSTDIGYGRADLITSRARAHDALGTTTGNLANAGDDAITTYTAMYYDAAGRVTHTADFGTNKSDFSSGGAAPTISQGSPPGLPAVADDPIVSEVIYDIEGRIGESIDPEGYRTRFQYDAMSRQVAIIENATTDDDLTWSTGPEPDRWSTSAFPASAPDENRTTAFVYDGNGNVVLRLAFQTVGSAENVQQTTYRYMEITGDATYFSNDVLHEVRYPDASLFTGCEESVLYSYNALGELIATERDQRGVSHKLTRDALGRVVFDEADVGSSGCGSEPDEFYLTVAGLEFDEQAIKFTYDDLGRLRLVTTGVPNSSGTSITTPSNEIWYGYDPLWQVDAIVSNPVGSTGRTIADDRADVEGLANRDGVLLIDYDLKSSADASNSNPFNYSRPTNLHYPRPLNTGATVVNHTYAGHGGIDARISRPTGLGWSSQGTAQSAVYGLIGMSTMATKALQTGLYLDFQRDIGGNVPSPVAYDGFDKFGRQTHVRWRNASGRVADYAYSYTPASNITSRVDDLAKDPSTGNYNLGRSNFEERFGYDGLHRLTTSDRSRVGSALPPHAPGSQQWEFEDSLGNWDTFWNKRIYPDTSWSGTFDSTDEEDRQSDTQANQLVSVTRNGTTLGRLYDNAGNLVVEYLSATNRRVYEYDAWNRLSNIYDEEKGSTWAGATRTTRARHTYYGQNQRATSVYDTDDALETGYGAPDRAVAYLYDPQWRLLETRSGPSDTEWEDAVPFPSGLADADQYIWGLTHIDELIAFQKDGDAAEEVAPDGSFDDAGDYLRYAIHDRNWSVLGFGAKVDRRYTPYGVAEPRALDGLVPRDGDMLVADVDFDGGSNAGDFNRIALNFGTASGMTFADGDVSGDGAVNASDFSVLAGVLGAQWVERDEAELFADPKAANGCLVGYAGYIRDPLTGMYCVRNRWYEPKDGRWMTRDPAGYVDGMHLYEYSRSNPVRFLDPFGLKGRKIWDGPEAAIIAWVDSFNPFDYAARVLSFELYGNEHTLGFKTLFKEKRFQLLSTAFSGLLATANPDPPASLQAQAGPRRWGSHEHRGWVYLKPELKCCDGKVEGHRLVASGSSAGYTPNPVGPGFSNAESHPTLTGRIMTRKSDNCITFSIQRASRVSGSGKFAGTVVALTVPAFISKQLKYTLCCDGNLSIEYWATHFPSHAAYFDGERIATSSQSGIGAFMYTGNRVAGMQLLTTMRGQLPDW
jgi:RHS repeat-associated protein